MTVTVADPLPVRFHDYPEPSPEERAKYLRENAERGTLSLVEYRNSPDGTSDEMAHAIELGIMYGRIKTGHGNQYGKKVLAINR